MNTVRDIANIERDQAANAQAAANLHTRVHRLTTAIIVLSVLAMVAGVLLIAWAVFWM